MPTVSLWWKPGCATNTRQIGLLREAGCEVVVHDLLTEAWTADALSAFFGARPVREWFNPAAPAVKAGTVVPTDFSAEAALARLVAEPLLIRRPLIEVNGERCCGFDAVWLVQRGIRLLDGTVPQGCSHAHSGDVAECKPPRNPAAYCAPPSGASFP
ncbi:MAG: hypothetical protein RBT39_11170 [Azoarcus sp.]|jgi:nitrogenase-associated protein|nr:hypothetical protein [Azoarcus sp.]MDD2873238.1 hypothetical protein [Azoarcus sp.]MDX9838113.1 hypothetical protein [Azoarcus sp.]